MTGERSAEGRLGAPSAGRLEGARPALDALLCPHAIAVVGASASLGSLGGLLFSNLAGSDFSGHLMPVNQKHPVVQGVTAYPDLASCPVVPDLAVVCVPAPGVAAVVVEAGELGVKTVCVISAGFAETGPAGSELQEELVEVAAKGGVRLVGPNCTGVLSGRGGHRFNATFGRTVPAIGGTCLLSQSGAFGLGLLELMNARDLGIASFVSVGNIADLGVAELVWYWGQDPFTDLILLYLESLTDAGTFIRVAREVGERVPVVALKAGRTKAGRRGAASHTAALSSGEVAIDAVFRQAGVLRAQSVREVLDFAEISRGRTRPRGPRVGIVTNGGGSGVLVADACEGNGLSVPELSKPTAQLLSTLLPPEASAANPVDMIASATARQYGEIVRALGASQEVDSVVVVFNVPVVTSAGEVAAELVAARAALERDVSLVAVFLNGEGPPPSLRKAGIPGFVFPEDAARALAGASAWCRGRAPGDQVGAPAGRIVCPVGQEVRPPAAHLLLNRASEHAHEGWLASADAEALLQSFGVAVPRSYFVGSPSAAAAAQAELGCPVVVKVAGALHKSDVGGVRLGVSTPEGAAAAVRSIRAGLEEAGIAQLGEEMLVQEQVVGGQEMIVGMDRDHLLGPLVMVGFGGALVELLNDVVVRVPPFSADEIDEMVCSLKAYRLLTGYRGAPPLDLGALHSTIQAVASVALVCPEVGEVDLNPLVVLRKGAVAVDVRVRLCPKAVSRGS
ncbi:MAG TPA: acetate--CoA ligase family protein [Acidimicrobiales bacterium]|nr:acetate--CoA ligase family protein [Acidimicrobiales bacterium]